MKTTLSGKPIAFLIIMVTGLSMVPITKTMLLQSSLSTICAVPAVAAGLMSGQKEGLPVISR